MARTARRYEAVQSMNTGNIWSREMVEHPEKTESYCVGIYSRLSVDHNDRKAESIENQIEIIRQYIAEENNRIKNGRKLTVHDIYIDRGISGTSFQREGFDRLMDDVRNRVVDCIIVKDLSRFGRDYVETGNYIEKILPFLGVRFIAVADGFDSMAEDVAERKLTMNLKNLVNDMYAKDISKRVTTARKLAAESGGYIGSTPPYGYQTRKTDGVRRLVVHEESAAVVRFLYDGIAKGMTPGQLSSVLYERKIHRISDYNRCGHVFCRGNEILHQWNPEVIRGLLSNSVYMGKLVQRKHQSLLKEGGEGTCETDREHWIIVENSHEPVVSQELFDQVKQILTRKKKEDTGNRPPENHENIFRNVLYCGKCGGKMHAVSHKNQANGKRSYSYECRRAHYIDGRKCEKNHIREETVERYVAEQIKGILKGQKITSKKLVSLNRKECEKAVAIYEEEIDQLLQEHQRLAAKAGEMYRQYKEGRITDLEYAAFRDNRAEHDSFCEKRIKELKRKIRKSEIRMEEENKFLRSLQSARGHKKPNVHLVDSLIERIDVFPEGKLEIRFLFGKGDSCYEEE